MTVSLGSGRAPSACRYDRGRSIEIDRLLVLYSRADIVWTMVRMREIDDVRLAFAIADRPGATHPSSKALESCHCLLYGFTFYLRFTTVTYTCCTCTVGGVLYNSVLYSSQRSLEKSCEYIFSARRACSACDRLWSLTPRATGAAVGLTGRRRGQGPGAAARPRPGPAPCRTSLGARSPR